jgi:predicted trehalose synthase
LASVDLPVSGAAEEKDSRHRDVDFAAGGMTYDVNLRVVMGHQKISQAQTSARAVEAAVWLARRLGFDSIDPIVLHESQHISIRLFPRDVVARVIRLEKAEAAERLHRELSVARYLAEKSAPVISPTTAHSPGPHFHEGFGLTLWQYVDHVAADGDNAQHAASAAGALRRVHEALADYRNELPSFWNKIDHCRALLEKGSALPALPVADRIFLLTTYNRLRACLDGLPMDVFPIHGDAHLGNVFITSDGARWNDFEDVCIGPREWDIGWLPDIESRAFEPIKRDLLWVLHYMRSLCVSVWCWDKYDLPERCEAAEYHLDYLRERFA